MTTQGNAFTFQLAGNDLTFKLVEDEIIHPALTNTCYNCGRLSPQGEPCPNCTPVVLDEEDEESRLDRLVSQQVPSLGAALARAKAKGHLQTVDPYGQS